MTKEQKHGSREEKKKAVSTPKEKRVEKRAEKRAAKAEKIIVV